MLLDSVKWRKVALVPERFLSLFNELPEGFLLVDRDGEILFINSKIPSILGYDDDGFSACRDQIFRQLIGKGIEEKSMSRQVTGQNGEIITVELSPFPIPNVTGESSTLLKVIRKGVALEEIAPALKEFPQFLNTHSDMVCMVSKTGKFSKVNQEFIRTFEIEEQSSLPPNIRDLYVNQSEHDDKVKNLIDKGHFNSRETLLLTRRGMCKSIQDTSWAVKDPDGKFLGYISMFKDLTNLKSLQSRLMISERSHGRLFDTIQTSIVVIDLDSKIINLNKSALEMYNYSWDDVVGKHYSVLLMDRDHSEKLTLEDILVDIPQIGSSSLEASPRRKKDGTVFFVSARYQEILDLAGEVVAYSVMESDLTRQVKLEEELKSSLKDVKETQSAAIMGFARLTEYRDKDTGNHLERIQHYTKLLAGSLRNSPYYGEYVTDEYLETISLSSTLHDVGKIGIEDRILLKEGKLTEEEYEEMKRHSTLGGKALESVDSNLESRSFLTMAKEIAYYHHEKWNGTGYPEGLSGTEIPLSARIVAIADAYDAMTSKRPYKEAWSHEKAIMEINRSKGIHFDPYLVDIVMAHHKEFRKIGTSIRGDQAGELSLDSGMKHDIRNKG